MIKSHKPGRRAAVGGALDEGEAPERHYRKLTLAQLERRVKKRKAGKTGVLGVLSNIVKNAGPAMQRMNQGMANSTKNMPNSKQITDYLWGNHG
jgi:hypothetical protein